MKKISASLLAIVFVLMLIPMRAHAASASMSGPSEARAGQTITVTFRVGGGSFYGYNGTLSYDSSVVTLQSVSNSAGSNWAFTRTGNKIVAYDNTGNNYPVSSAFTAKFTVNSGVSAGTAIKISFSGTVSGNGSEAGVSGTYNGKVAAPLSSDATLSSLVVGNAKLSPAFNANTTSYSCGTVGFEVSKLSISAKANASGAKVSVSGSNLSVGKNTVYITVTAPNGAKKTYTITVTREQDPNYKPSTNTKLSGITLSAGQLSPEFSADTKEYVVYVPYETAAISITGAAADPLAKGVANVTDAALKVGLNELSLKCTAEDGTEGIYKFYVVRMNEFGGVSTIALPGEYTPEEKEPETSSAADNEKTSSESAQGVSPVLLGVLGVVCLILGIAIGALIVKKRNADRDSNIISDDAGDEQFEAPDFDDEN